MNKKKKLLIVVLLFVMTLSGCVKQQYDIIVTDDSIEYVVTISLDNQLQEINKKNKINNKDIEKDYSRLLNEYIDAYEGYGFKAKKSTNKTTTTMEFKKKYKDTNSFMEDMEALYTEGYSGLYVQLERSNNLKGVTNKYKTRLEYVVDKDAKALYDKYPEIQEMVDLNDMTATLNIHDDNHLLSSEGIDFIYSVGKQTFSYQDLIELNEEIESDEFINYKDAHLITENVKQSWHTIKFIFYVVIFVLVALIVIFLTKNFNVIVEHLRSKQEKKENK